MSGPSQCPQLLLCPSAHCCGSCSWSLVLLKPFCSSSNCSSSWPGDEFGALSFPPVWLILWFLHLVWALSVQHKKKQGFPLAFTWTCRSSSCAPALLPKPSQCSYQNCTRVLAQTDMHAAEAATGRRCPDVGDLGRSVALCRLKAPGCGGSSAAGAGGSFPVPPRQAEAPMAGSHSHARGRVEKHFREEITAAHEADHVLQDSISLMD